MNTEQVRIKNLSYDWDSKASVRTSKETYNLNTGLNDGVPKSWSSEQYTPFLSNPLLENIDFIKKNYIMGMQLLEFVIKTERFEIDYVNKVASNISLGRYNFKLTEDIRLNALKIYTDEGYHAYFSQKIANQIKSHYEIKDDITAIVEVYINKLKTITNKFGDQYRDIATLGLVLVGENMIVSDISDEMKQIQYEPIRIMFKNHMLDESFHAKYFAELLKNVWDQLNNIEKEILGLAILDGMIVIGSPRLEIHYYSLSKLGFSNEQINLCLSEYYNPIENQEKLNKKMNPTIKLLDSCNVFKNKTISKAFLEKGFTI